MATLNPHTNRAGGTTLTAAIYNEDHQRHYANAEALNTELASKLTQADLTGIAGVPVGGIIAWSGSIAAIPMGWQLCNGTNGTPDLRNRFLLGAGTTYDPGDTGGSETVTLTTAQLPAHNHTASTSSEGLHSHSASTGTAGAHAHGGTQWPNSSEQTTQSGFRMGSGYQDPQGGSISIRTVVSMPTAGNHTHSVSIGNAGSHTHTITVGNTGGGNSHNNMPPYFALAFIMRMPDP